MPEARPPARRKKPPADAVCVQATIVNQRGLHARAAARLAALAETFDAELTIHGNGQSVSALSIMDLLLLAAAPGTSIEISATGKGARQAVSAIAALVEAGFDEN